MKLTYAVDGVSEVSVGLLGTNIIQNFEKNGVAKVLTQTAETFISDVDVNKLAVIDFHRAVWAAWAQTYMNDKWQDSVRCDCGLTVNFVHDIAIAEPEPLDVFGKVVKIKGPDVKTFKPIEYEFVLEPLTIQEYEQLQDKGEVIVKVIEAYIKTQLPKTESLPLGVYSQLSKMIKTDLQAASQFGIQSLDCEKCSKTVYSQASIQNANFLTPATL